MPIYEYQCESCQHEFEALQKLSEAPLVDCPACAQPALIKKISAAGFRLKGSGWYETDFKSSNRKNLAGDGGDSKKSESKKSDSQPASKGSTAA
ncbi:zinc ribbon domain-containing protein [Marinimicrobium sp. ABcell2]|uniref:FmdB family zinc ribbon protein n=1 Tax=Marinimicrobium sp. ABcell2 TaxID=3069751 RepID=UPI0027AF6644|nr:zinc ribbon domain-containing protein [Marinimicrobium sp. ABcell2]MDQ2077908.1 zinc ribbon domain-containing protein [Marinimicrobium sp. ABcell2]